MKASLLALLLLSGPALWSQPQQNEILKDPAILSTGMERDSLESAAMNFYSACHSPVENLVPDYKTFLSPELLTPETELKIKALDQSLEGKSFVQAQLVRANSVENLFFILLYHPITLEDYGRIRIVFKNDGDQLIDAWDFR